jgi:hypothetical protein
MGNKFILISDIEYPKHLVENASLCAMHLGYILTWMLMVFVENSTIGFRRYLLGLPYQSLYSLEDMVIDGVFDRPTNMVS